MSKDMMNYIRESGTAVRWISENQAENFNGAIDMCLEKNIQHIYIVGSGTSYHAGVGARNIIQDELKIPVDVRYAMQFKDSELLVNPNALVIGVSHEGHSTSTIAALKRAKAADLLTIAMTVEKDTPVAKAADCYVPIAIGSENVGPKTKGYIGSMANVILFLLEYGVQKKIITAERKNELSNRMFNVTDRIPQIAEAAEQWYAKNREDLLKSRRIITVGYKNCLSAMMEGTLKMEESLRYSVVGYDLEEFMHGIYHSIDENTYLFYLASSEEYFDRCIRMKMYFEKERHSHNYVFSAEKKANDQRAFIFDFKNDPYFMSMEYVVPMQVFARLCSLDLGIDCEIPSDPLFHEKMGSYTY